jgi:hypothetical protein
MATLEANPEWPPDTLIIHRIKVIRIATEAIRLFDHGSVDAMKSIDDDRIQILTKILERQLQEVETALPATLRGDGTWQAHPISQYTDHSSFSVPPSDARENMHQ